MTKEKMLDIIYEKIADKTLWRKCLIRHKSWWFWEIIHIYWEEDEIWGVQYNGSYFRDTPIEIKTLTKDRFLNEWSIYWHLVMIWDILDYIKENDLDRKYWKYGTQWSIVTFINPSTSILYFWKNKRLPIEEQSKGCITYIHNLIK